TQVVSLDRVSAARAPTDGERIGIVEAAKVCPFTEIRFAENDRSRRAESIDQWRIRRNPAAIKRERTCGGLHVVERGGVVLYQKRNPVEQAAHVTGLALVVKTRRDGNRVRIRLDACVKRRI